MLDASFASLEADYTTTLARRDRDQPHPRRPRRDDARSGVTRRV
jgi:hypothetical protein